MNSSEWEQRLHQTLSPMSSLTLYNTGLQFQLKKMSSSVLLSSVTQVLSSNQRFGVVLFKEGIVLNGHQSAPAEGQPGWPSKAECIYWFSILTFGNSLPLTLRCDTGPGGKGLADVPHGWKPQWWAAINVATMCKCEPFWSFWIRSACIQITYID